jgi:hypothetical protein
MLCASAWGAACTRTIAILERLYSERISSAFAQYTRSSSVGSSSDEDDDEETTGFFFLLAAAGAAAAAGLGAGAGALHW